MTLDDFTTEELWTALKRRGVRQVGREGMPEWFAHMDRTLEMEARREPLTRDELLRSAGR